MIFLEIILICLGVFLFLFCGLIIFNNMMLFGFLYADYTLRSFSKPHEYPRVTIGKYAKNFWLELYYIFGKFYLLPLKWMNLTVKGSNTNTVILLVHGYCRNQTDWLWFRKQFKDTNFPIYTVNLEPNFASIPDITKCVVEKVKQIKAETNCKEIIMIGHSMGGIASSYYSEFLDQDKLIKAVFTIASPLSGTRVSVFAKGENAQQMCPGSRFLSELHTRMHNNPEKYYQICSKFDNIVFPWKSSLQENTPHSHQFVLPFAGHLSMLHNKEVTQQLNKWIKALSE